MKITRRTMLLALCVLVLAGGAIAIFYDARSPAEPKPVSQAKAELKHDAGKERALAKQRRRNDLMQLTARVALENPKMAAQVKPLTERTDTELFSFITASTKDCIERGLPQWDYFCSYVATRLSEAEKHGEAVELLRCGIEMGEKRAISSDALGQLDSRLGQIFERQDKYEEAESAFRNAVTRYENPRGNTYFRVNQELALASFLKKRGRISEAISITKRIVARADSQSDAATKRATELLSKLELETR